MSAQQNSGSEFLLETKSKSSDNQGHYTQSQEDDQFLRSLWGSANQYDNNNNNNNFSSDISISASSGDSNSIGLSPPEMNSASASNHSNSDPESPGDFKDFIFNSNNSYSQDKYNGELFGNGNMMMGMGIENGAGGGLDSFHQDNQSGGNNGINMGSFNQGMSPFIFANGVLQGTNEPSPNHSNPNPSPRRNTSTITSPSSTSFNHLNSGVDPSMMSNLNSNQNSNQFMARFGNGNGNQMPLPPTHIQNQMQQLSPHTSTANYQAQLHSFLQQQAQQFSQQHHQQALIQAQALAYAQSQYVATIQNQQHQLHQQQQSQRQSFNSNNTLGLSPSSISGSSVNSPESNQVDLQSLRNQSFSNGGGLAPLPAATVELRSSGRDPSQAQQSAQSQPQQAISGSKTKINVRKRKGSDEGQQVQESHQSHQSFLSGMPKMEVGSNATARAAIQRLRAKQQADSQLSSDDSNSNSKTNSQHSIPSSRAAKVEQESIQSSTSSTDKQPRSQKKVAHNAIERRYRNNINDRISALRSAVPALCELRAKPKGKGKKNAADDLVDGVAAATKLNKGVILGKATEYIHHLKKRETSLSAEVTGLRELVKSLEGGEELLELWEAEWQKLQAEKEREEKANQSSNPLSGGDSYDAEEDEEDEEDDEDERPHKLQRTSGSPTSTTSVSSGRYMMAAFLGISLFGGAAEINTASHASSSVVPPASPIHAAGGRVIGAGHQLLKRANLPVVDSNVTHHFDHVPTHALAFEILRAIMVVAIVFFIFWPMISRFFRRSSSPSESTREDTSRLSANAQRRQTMLSVLSRRHPSPSPSELDQALRVFLRAPESRLSATLGLVVEAGRYALRRAPFGKIIEREEMSNDEREKATVWLRLLEVESILRDEAQASDLIRAHTIVKVANMRLPSKPTDSTNSPLTPARINATIAVALARAEGRNGRILRRRSSLDGISKSSSSPSQTWTMDAAQEFWTRAQKSMMVEEEEMEEAREESRARSAISGEPSLTTGTTGWLSSVLRLGMDEALTLCPSQSDVSHSFREAALAAEQELQSSTNGSSSVTHSLSLRALDTSPLQAIADAKHQRELAGVWAKLFGNVVKSTCPNTQEGSRNPLSDFIDSSISSSKSFNMHVVNDLSSRAALTTQISRLAATAPPSTPSSSLSRTTLAAWALLVGNVPVARSLAAKLALRGPAGEEPITRTCAAAHSLVEFVLGNPNSAGAFFDGGSKELAPTPFDDVDALASAAIQWLAFLRQFNSRVQFAKQLVERSKQDKVEESNNVESGTPKINQVSSFNSSFSTRAEAQADQQLVSSALNLRKLLAKAEPITISLALRSIAATSSKSSRNHHQQSMENESSDSSSEDSTSTSSKSSSSSSTNKSDSESPNLNSKFNKQNKRLALKRAERIRNQALEIEMELEDARDAMTDILTLLGRKATKSIKSSSHQFIASEVQGRNGSWLRKVLEMRNRDGLLEDDDDAFDSEDDSGVGEFE